MFSLGMILSLFLEMYMLWPLVGDVLWGSSGEGSQLVYFFIFILSFFYFMFWMEGGYLS